MSVTMRAITESEGTPPRALALADALDIPTQPGTSGSVRELLRVGSVPRYRPERWNHALPNRINNNCYNYGTDVLNHAFGQPGLASGVRVDVIGCADYTGGAIGDGLISTGSEPSLAGEEFGHVAALVIAPARDFHWYRLGRDGMWSHKPGSTEATNLDNSDRPITDPRTADRWIYTQFCGFFCVPRGGVSIAGPGPYIDPVARASADVTIVRLLVFSGRPNPEWVLDPDEGALLAAKLSSARRGTRLTAATSLRPRRLGFSGFLIDRPGRTPGARDITQVHAGVVSDVRLTGAEHRADADGLEDELLEQARRHGFGDLL